MSWRPGTQPGLSATPALLRRRGFLLSLQSPAGLLAAGTVPSAQAGRQLEEPLADAVRTALSASIESPGARLCLSLMQRRPATPMSAG
jgi:hypothetical protein